MLLPWSDRAAIAEKYACAASDIGRKEIGKEGMFEVMSRIGLIKDLWCLEQNESWRQCFSEDMCSLKQRLGFDPEMRALGDCWIWE